MSVISNGIEFIGTVFEQFWAFTGTEDGAIIRIALYVVAVGSVVGLLMWLVKSLAGIGGGSVSSPAVKKKGEK